MSGIVGVLLVALGVVAFQLACLVFQRPNPPAWVHNKLAHEGITLSMVTMVGFGIGLMVNFLAHFEEERFGLYEGGLMLAIVLASGVLVRFLARRLQQGSPAEATRTDPPNPIPGGPRTA